MRWRMAAVHAALLSRLRAGDHVVAARSLYGNTAALLRGVLARCGVETTFADATDLAALRGALRKTTRVVLCETVANPTLDVTDLPAVAALAHEAGASLFVDNTFATPYLCRPAEHGADLIVHSATKYLGGHGDLIWAWLSAARRRRRSARRRDRRRRHRRAPLVAWLCLRGVRTSRCGWSATRPARARAPARRPHQGRARLLPDAREPPAARRGAADARRRRHGSGRRGRRCRRAALLDGLRLFRRAGSLGDVHSLAVHPASTSHRQLSAEDRRAAGLADGLVRLSVGLKTSRISPTISTALGCMTRAHRSW